MDSIDPTTELGQRMQAVDLTGRIRFDALIVTTVVAAIEDHYNGNDEASKLYHDLVKYIGDNLKPVWKIIGPIRSNALKVIDTPASGMELDQYISIAKLCAVTGYCSTKRTAFVVYAATDCTTPATYEWLVTNPDVADCCYKSAVGILRGVLKNGDKTATILALLVLRHRFITRKRTY